MKTWKIITIALVAAIVVSIPTIAILTQLNAQPQYNPYLNSQNTMQSNYQTSPRTYNSQTQNTQGETTQQTANQIFETPQLSNEEPPILYNPTYGYNGWGGGCRGRGFYASNLYPTTQTTTLTIQQAAQTAQSYINTLNNQDLMVDEVEEFTNNFYILVKEKSTGYGAFELLIDKYTGIITPEKGPNMMWNTKYQFNTGYCNWYGQIPTTTQTITLNQAQTNAQQYLDTYYPGTTADEATTFYGYYTFEVLNNSEIYGMLSVNSYTGQVWFHNWHGMFIQELSIT